VQVPAASVTFGGRAGVGPCDEMALVSLHRRDTSLSKIR